MPSASIDPQSLSTRQAQEGARGCQGAQETNEAVSLPAPRDRLPLAPGGIHRSLRGISPCPEALGGHDMGRVEGGSEDGSGLPPPNFVLAGNRWSPPSPLMSSASPGDLGGLGESSRGELGGLGEYCRGDSLVGSSRGCQCKKGRDEGCPTGGSSGKGGLYACQAAFPSPHHSHQVRL